VESHGEVFLWRNLGCPYYNLSGIFLEGYAVAPLQDTLGIQIPESLGKGLYLYPSVLEVGGESMDKVIEELIHVHFLRDEDIFPLLEGHDDLVEGET